VKEEDIIVGCIKNDRKAQEILYMQFLGAMWSICSRYIDNKEEAIEVLNDGYLKVFKHIDTYKKELSSLNTWMSRIMVNTCIDYLRKRKALKYVSIEEVTEGSDTKIEHLLDDYTSQELISFINQLPRTTRVVFNLYVVEGYSHEEIASFLNISSSTSRWHLTEAKKRLRQIIKENV